MVLHQAGEVHFDFTRWFAAGLTQWFLQGNSFLAVRSRSVTQSLQGTLLDGRRLGRMSLDNNGLRPSSSGMEIKIPAGLLDADADLEMSGG